MNQFGATRSVFRANVLRVTDAGNTNNSDHGDWADAKLIRLSGS